MFIGFVAADRPRFPRAALPHNPRSAVLSNLYCGHEARSHPGDDSQDHRAGGNFQKDRLLAAAHGPLRAGRHLRQHSRRRGQGWYGWTARRLHHGLRDIRGAWTLGDRSWSPNTALRLLVEPAARLYGDERVGVTTAVREWDRAGGSTLE